MVTGSSRGAPVHRMSWLGIAMAVVAGVLALYGSMHAEKHLAGSPLCAARGEPATAPPDYKPFGDYVRHRLQATNPSGLARGVSSAYYGVVWSYRYGGGALDRDVMDRTKRSKLANYSLQLVAFVLPFFLGVAGALTGGWAMKLVQQSGGKYVGNTFAVFSMMIGGLAAVVAACMMATLYLWPLLPSFYTT